MLAWYTHMAAARFSNDVLERFYGPLSQEENRRQKKPIEPAEKEIILMVGFVREKSMFQKIIHPEAINLREKQKRSL